MLKDIFLAPALGMQQAELCAFQAEGFQRKSERCGLIEVLQPSWTGPGATLHLVWTNIYGKAAVNVRNQILLLAMFHMITQARTNKVGVLMRENFHWKNSNFFQKAKWKARCSLISVIPSTTITRGKTAAKILSFKSSNNNFSLSWYNHVWLITTF